MIGPAGPSRRRAMNVMHLYGKFAMRRARCGKNNAMRDMLVRAMMSVQAAR